jgi:hypothetical protein
MEHVKLVYTPEIIITAEHAADVLSISLEKADQLLSSPDTFGIVQEALSVGLQEALLKILQEMVRKRWPQDTLPIRRDCVVRLPNLPGLDIVGEL